MECFAIDQERFGVDNTGFEDSDDKEFLALKEQSVKKLKMSSVPKIKKRKKVREKFKCSTQGCQNIPPSKSLLHPKTERKCYIACRPTRVSCATLISSGRGMTDWLFSDFFFWIFNNILWF
ncbi:unnamed protein product [Caenorhabditis brenneri]